MNYLRKPDLAALYLEYFNDFLTVARFGEYHGLTEKQAYRVIELGRKYYAESHTNEEIIRLTSQ